MLKCVGTNNYIMKNLKLIFILFFSLSVLTACGNDNTAEDLIIGEVEVIEDVMEEKSEAMEAEIEVAMKAQESIPVETPKVEEEPEVVQEPAKEPTPVVKEPSGALTIESGSITYSVEKGWLNKPTETVTGTTSSVSGSGTLNNGVLSVNAEINAKNFNSGSGGRDNHVAGLFSGNVKVTGNSIALSSTFAMLNITINGVTSTVPFVISISDQGDTVSASGNGSFKFSTFNIEPPSIANLYTTGDSVKMNFSVTASKN